MMEYNNTLRESWASYVGWELGESYYATQGVQRTPATSVSRLDDYTGQYRHTWQKTHTNPNSDLYAAHYSPLFIDLRDEFNQGYFSDGWVNSDYHNDDVSNLPYSWLTHLATHPYTLEEFYTELVQLFIPSSGDFGAMIKASKYMEPYRHWEANNTRDK